MKILVAIKSLLDSALAAESLPPSLIKSHVGLDPFSEVALEFALRWREQNIATEVIAVNIGTKEQGLRTALALGADQAIQVPLVSRDCAVIAEALAKVSQILQPDLILCGKQSADEGNYQTPLRLAARLGWSQLSAVDQLTWEAPYIKGSGLTAAGQAHYQLRLPAVIGVDLRLATPRFASLPNLLKARRAPILNWDEVAAACATSTLNPGLHLYEQQPMVLQRQTVTLANSAALSSLLFKGC